MPPTDEFGRHEVVHTASIIVDLIDRELLSHGAVANNPKWKNLVQIAFDAIQKVYQETSIDTGIRNKGELT